MNDKPLYVASWSGGKDSTATIILAHEKGEPLDLIIFSEVMFDKNISGELPEHIEFIHRCKKTFEEWGYSVKILRSDKTYMDTFNHVVQKSKIPERNGKRAGFPMSGKCFVNRDCKIEPIRKFNKEHPNAIHYVGIAIDEPKRLERLNDKTISLLAKYGYSKADAYDLCKIYDMLSPVYQYANRGGVGSAPTQGTANYGICEVITESCGINCSPSKTKKTLWETFGTASRKQAYTKKNGISHWKRTK